MTHQDPGAPVGLTVARRVIAEVVLRAALDVPGVIRVSRGGSRWLGWLRGSPLRVRVRDGRVEARIIMVARAGQSLAGITHDVRAAAGAAIERLLGLQVARVTVIVDGVGA
jgi:uncharacterized alkaline shock family protein YloU